MRQNQKVKPCCGNCGHGYPPYKVWQESRYVQCMFYNINTGGVLKPVGYSCKAHDFHVSAGVAPYWCKPYSKERKSAEEISAYFSVDVVRNRLKSEVDDEKTIFPHCDNTKLAHIAGLQKHRIDRCFEGLLELEQAPVDQQWRIGLELKVEMKRLDTEIERQWRY